MEGIVIKSIDYKEKSKLVYLYTPLGMCSVKALDIAKSKLGFITTLNQVEYVASTSKLPTVLEYSIKESFYSLYESLDKVGVLVPIIDTIMHLEEQVNHERIYSFLIRTLKALKENHQPLFVLSTFLVKMLAVFGVKPQLSHCVFCGSTNIVSFSIMDGGALCDACAAPNDLNYRLYQSLKALYFAKDFSEIKLSLSYKDLLDYIYNYYLIHANIKLKKYQL